jgi:hypothetical protein
LKSKLLIGIFRYIFSLDEINGIDFKENTGRGKQQAVSKGSI